MFSFRDLVIVGLILAAQIGHCQEELSQSNSTNIPSEIPKAQIAKGNKKYPSIFEFKAGYFFFSNSKMRKVYDHGGLDLQFSGSGSAVDWFHLYGSVEFLSRHGRSLAAGYKTKIWQLPISFGLRPVLSICKTVQYYLTVGPRYVYVHVHNHSPFVDRSLVEHAFGGFVNTGFNFFPLPYLAIDVFGEYSYVRARMDPSRTNVFANRIQIGGFTFGLGLGYAF